MLGVVDDMAVRTMEGEWPFPPGRALRCQRPSRPWRLMVETVVARTSGRQEVIWEHHRRARRVHASPSDAQKIAVRSPVRSRTLLVLRSLPVSSDSPLPCKVHGRTDACLSFSPFPSRTLHTWVSFLTHHRWFSQEVSVRLHRDLRFRLSVMTFDLHGVLVAFPTVFSQSCWTLCTLSTFLPLFYCPPGRKNNPPLSVPLTTSMVPLPALLPWTTHTNHDHNCFSHQPPTPTTPPPAHPSNFQTNPMSQRICKDLEL